MEPVQQAGIFPETRWSLILRLRTAGTEPSGAQALNELCQLYWQPLYAYLRRTGQDREEAKDAVQGFLAHFLLKNGFVRVGPADGRFRHFLLGALRNYLVSEARKQAAAKRGGGLDFVRLDIDEAEQMFQTQAPEPLSPEAAFDRQWAQTVWTRAVRRLREEQIARGKGQFFEALKPCLTEELRQKHAQVAAQLGLAAQAVALAVHRLRRRLRELVLEELAQTVGTNGELDEELKYFLSVWSK